MADVEADHPSEWDLDIFDGILRMRAVTPPRLLVVTNEASGDAAAGEVVARLRERFEALEIRAMGGAALAREGAEIIVDVERTTTMGGLEVVRRLPALLRARRRLLRVAMTWRPSAAMLVDAPDFNGPLGASLRSLGVPVTGYVSPQFWAWRRGRAAGLPRQYDRMACVLPFEAHALRQTGLDARFVGHPAAEGCLPSRDAAIVALGGSPRRRRLALLPGSRPSEVHHHLPAMVEVGRRLRADSDIDVLLAVAPTVSLPELPSWVIPVTSDHHRFPGRFALAAADAAIVASGTATLEAALGGVPQVIVYRTSTPTWVAARLLVRTRFVGLPNLVLGRNLVPELLQTRVEPEALTTWCHLLLEGGSRAAEQRSAALELRQLLRGPGASRTTASMVAESMS